MKHITDFFKRTVPALLMLLAPLSIWAQGGVKVRGTVAAEGGDPLIGATVLVKGNAGRGTITDIEGNFEIEVPSEQSTLVFSYVGMITKEVKVGKQRNIKVSLAEEN
jgi:hypothetical protein